MTPPDFFFRQRLGQKILHGRDTKSNFLDLVGAFQMTTFIGLSLADALSSDYSLSQPNNTRRGPVGSEMSALELSRNN